MSASSSSDERGDGAQAAHTGQPSVGGEGSRPATPSERRLDFLDVARALAACSVLFTHMGNPLPEGTWGHSLVSVGHSLVSWTVWANGGLHGAVVVFIVLSGFCIHMSVAKRGQASFDLRSYAIRRAVRIYPVLVAAMLLGITAALLEGGATPLAIGTNAAQNLTLLSGLWPLEPPVGNEILLTVIVECLLYALYPLGLALLRRTSWTAIVAIALLVYAANVVATFVLRLDPTWSQRDLWAFLLYWVLGAYAAERAFAARPMVGDRLLTRPWLIAIAVSYLVVANVARFEVRGAHLVASPALATITACFLAAGARRPTSMRILPAWPWSALVRIGDRSYSLYVVHWPVLVMTAGRVTGSVGYVAVLAAVVVACLAMYELVESPSHRLAVRRGARR